MLSKKITLGIAAGVAALGLSSVALASGGGYYEPPSAAVDNGAGFYIGAGLGYALTHWDNIDPLLNDDPGDFTVSVEHSSGFAARPYIGYAFNRYFAIEGGWTYLPSNVEIQATDNTTGATAEQRIKNWAIDVSGKFTLPVQDNFGVFTTLGVDYLHSKGAFKGLEEENGDTGTTGNVNVTFGAGIYYCITSNFEIDARWIRFDGHTKFDDHYQPNPDVFLAGLSYRFPGSDIFSS